MAPVQYPGITKEEFASAMSGWDAVISNSLAGGKTIFYEYETIDKITSADIKSFTTIQCLTDNIGGLHPYITIESVLNIQQ